MMGSGSLFPAWVRRAIEAAAAAGILAIASLLGTGLATGVEPVAIPRGLTGSLLLAPAVLSLGVIATAYPIALSATRSDALLAAAAAFLIAADLTLIVASGEVAFDTAGVQLPAGLLVALIAVVPAAIGVIAGQLASPVGFGRRAGAATALVSAIVAIAILALVPVFA